MAKKKKGFIIALAVLVIFSALYFILKFLNLSEEETESETDVKKIFEIDAAEIAQIKLEYNENVYTFLHENDKWSYAEDMEFPLSESSILDFVSNVTSIESSRKIENPEELTEYGLDNPEIKITVQDKNGKQVLLEFGNDNEAVGSCYVKKDGEKPIYLVDSTIKQKFGIEIKDLAEKEEIPILSSTTIQKVEIDKEGITTRLKKDEASETGWTYEAIQNGKNTISVAADSGKVSNIMGNYSGVTWQEFVSYDKNNLSIYGLDSPVAVNIEYEVTETADEDEESTEEAKTIKDVVFYIGKQDEDGDYYATLKDGKYIYTISASAAENIMTISEENLVSSLVADYSFADLDKVTFVRNNERYTATKKEEDSEQNYYLNDKEIDKTTFLDFFAKVSGMEWQNRSAEAEPENSSEMTIIFEKEGGMKVTVDYYSYDANFYLVVDSKDNKMLVNKMKVREMLEAFDNMIEEWKK